MRSLMRKLALIVAAFAVTAIFVARASAASFFDDIYPGFFTLQKPATLNLMGFGGGFVSDKYGTLQEGAQLDQSITPYIGAVARVTGYQLWEGEGFDNPLNPGTGHQARL